MAVASDGALYVAERAGHIKVFSPGAHGRPKPIRTLDVSGFVDADAIDPQGFLYVTEDSGFSAGISVYAPGAKGSDPPVAMISLGGGTGGGYGLALDVDGNLYATDDLGGHLLVYASPTTSPTLIREVCLKYQTVGVTIGHGVVFIVVNNARKGTTRFVARLDRAANGCPAPTPAHRFSS